MSHFLARLFHFQEQRTTLKTEIIAGLTTFSTLAYIIVVNPQILAQTGMDFGACMVATILSSAIANLCMGLMTNYPFALAPSMGLNAYFTYGLVLGEGHSWQTALGASFLAGLFFLALTAVNLRTYLMYVIPPSLRLGTVGGIGFFLSLIGMKDGGVIVSHPTTLVTLGDITRPEVVLNLVGVVAIAALLAWRFRAAILLGITLNWLLGLALGLTAWQGIFALPPSIEPTFLKMDIRSALHPAMISVVLSFIFVAIFDTAGILLGLAGQAGYLNKEGELPDAKKVMLNDAIGTTAGAMMGTSPLSIYLESASGIAAGGKTGFTAIVVAILFLLSLFLSPLVTSIPHFATSPALIIIGAMMMRQIKDIDWKNPTEFIPACLIFLTIPLSYSIATGMAIGFIVYPLIKLFSGKLLELSWIVWVIGALFALRFIYS